MRWVFAGVLFMAVSVALACGDPEEDVAEESPTGGAPRASATPTAAATPTPSSTPATSTATPAIPADWATFTDPVFGFSVRYPPDLAVEDLTGPSPAGGLMERVFLWETSDQSVRRGFATSIVYDAGKDVDLREWAYSTAGCRPETIEETTIVGHAGVWCTREVLSDHPNLAAFAIVGDDVVLVTNAGLAEAEFRNVVRSISF